MEFKVGGINDRRLLSNDLVSENYLQVNCCGITGESYEERLVVRPEGRRDYQLILVLSGEALFKHQKKEISIKSGDAILLPPHIRNQYFFLPGSNIIWIHFTGACAEQILSDYALEGYIRYSVSSPEDFLWHAEKIIEEFQLKRVGYMNNCNAFLLNILTLLRRKIDNRINSSSAGFIPEIAAVLEDMKTHFSDRKTIADFAQNCNLSVSRFAHLFAKTVGVSPYQYLINLRIRQGKYLLMNTNLSVSDISKSVGYDEPPHFSRIFKKHEGMSPAQFRKQHGISGG